MGCRLEVVSQVNGGNIGNKRSRRLLGLCGDEMKRVEEFCDVESRPWCNSAKSSRIYTHDTFKILDSNLTQTYLSVTVVLRRLSRRSHA